MSVVCDQCGRVFGFGETLQVGKRPDVEGGAFWPLCEEDIYLIPVAQRRTFPCPSGDKGIDIHKATALRQPANDSYDDDRYQGKSFKCGEFLFSVSRETAEKYLKNFLRRKQFD